MEAISETTLEQFESQAAIGMANGDDCPGNYHDGGCGNESYSGILAGTHDRNMGFRYGSADCVAGCDSSGLSARLGFGARMLS